MSTAKDVAEVIGNLITALAVVVGAAWAYFKFVRARTLRPRLAVDLQGEWLRSGTRDFVRARVTVTNIGGTDVHLQQEGTGLRVSGPTAGGAAGSMLVPWEKLGTFTILKEHQWIEPGETVSDEMLLNQGRKRILLFEARLVWRFGVRRRNVVVFARQVIPADGRVSTSVAR